jgi:hypothetical protein
MGGVSEGESFLLRVGKPLMFGTIVDDAVLSDGAGMIDTRDRDKNIHFFLAAHRSGSFYRIIFFGTCKFLEKLQFFNFDSIHGF